MPPVRLDRDGDVAELVLAAPPLNLFDDALFTALVEAVAAVEADLPRALIVRAEGRVFTAGVDVHIFEGLDAASATSLTSRYLDLAHRVEALPLPTLALAHGLCLTAGFELSLACDLLWAARNVQFGPALYSAETLHEWGVVNRVLDSGDLLGSGRRFAALLAAGPTRAHAATKAVVQAQSDRGVAGADDSVADLTSHLFETRDTRAAIETFLAEGPGKAVFTGE